MTDVASGASFQIGLSGWVIADGNYADFSVGETRPFALEYYNKEPLRPIPKSRDRRAMNLIREAQYAVSGRLAFEAPDWAVIDVGVLAYREHSALNPPPKRFEGEIWLGVDPFTYFEGRLPLMREAPPLIFRWLIRRIESIKTPLILQDGMWTYDQSRPKLVDVADTKDGGEFVLHCELLAEPPSRTLY